METDGADLQVPIFVKTLTGRKVNIIVNTSWSVARFTLRLFDMGIAGASIRASASTKALRFVYGGRQFSQDATLADYNLQPQATVHIVLNLGGRPMGWDADMTRDLYDRIVEGSAEDLQNFGARITIDLKVAVLMQTASEEAMLFALSGPDSLAVAQRYCHHANAKVVGGNRLTGRVLQRFADLGVMSGALLLDLQPREEFANLLESHPALLMPHLVEIDHPFGSVFNHAIFEALRVAHTPSLIALLGTGIGLTTPRDDGCTLLSDIREYDYKGPLLRLCTNLTRKAQLALVSLLNKRSVLPSGVAHIIVGFATHGVPTP